MAAVLQLLLAAVLLLGGVSAARAEGYPARPVRVVVGFPAGGPTDVIARMVAQKLSDALGQQFFVENIGGAGGNIASGQVARATPDGYTIMAISTGFVVNPSLYAKVPYDTVKDFDPVTLVAVSPNVVVVNPAVPAKSLPELVKLIQGQSRQIQLCRSRRRLDAASRRRTVPADLQSRSRPCAVHGRGAGRSGHDRRPHADCLYRPAVILCGDTGGASTRARCCGERARAGNT